MHVYFVRHGETDLNVRHLLQSPSVPLNVHGYDEARTVGEYLRVVNAGRLVTSSQERALQTARTIGSIIGLTPQPMSMFREIDRPTALIAVSIFNIRTLWYLTLSVLHRNNLKWRYKDAENFGDIYRRVHAAFTYIESLAEEHKPIIIVSHSVFINLMITYMCHDRILTLRDIVKTLLHINELKNCDVIHAEYVGPAFGNTCAWELVKS